MAILDKIKTIGQTLGLLEKSYNFPEKDGNQWFYPFGFTGTTNIKSQQAYEAIALVFMIVNKIQQRASTAILELYNSKDEKQTSNKDLVTNLVQKVNSTQTIADLIIDCLGFEMLFGEYFLLNISKVAGSEKGMPQELLCIPPNEITILQNGRNEIIGYQHNLGKHIIPIDKIYHVKKWNPDKINHRGISPLKAAGFNISTVNTASQKQDSLIRNNGVPGVAYAKGFEGEPLDQQSFNMFVDELERGYSNPSRAGRVAKFNQEVGFTSFGSADPSKLMINEAIEFNEKRIAWVLNYPTTLLSDKTGSLNSNERKEAHKQMILDCVFPRLECFFDALTKIYFPKNDYYFSFDKMAFSELEPDFKSTSDALKGAWYLTGDEMRKAMGYAELGTPEMSQIFTPNGLVPIEDVGKMPDIQENAKYYNE